MRQVQVFIIRALADSYRAELVRPARRGQEFSPATGEPAAWATPEPVTVTWYQHAVAYAEMKWPHLAAHSLASLAFNAQQRRSRAPDPATASTLAWLEGASLPVGQLNDSLTGHAASRHTFRRVLVYSRKRRS